MARKDAKIEKLRQVPLFAACSSTDLARIASVADEVSFRPGRVLMKEGAPGREFVVLLDGEVEVQKGGRKIPATGGDFYGELALLTNAPRNATVTTTTPVRALVITDRAFRSMLESAPKIAVKILQTVSERLGDTG